MPQGLSTAEDGQEKTKKKKWWGDLFRRRSKKVSDSSSEGEDEEPAKRRGGFLRRKKHDRGSKDVTSSFLINPGLTVQDRGQSLDSVKSSSLSRKRVKAKVEASREQLAKESSSDEGSSYTSSLPSGGSYPRRSRAARTERHNRRLWSASVVYQESNDYQENKFRAKAKSATPSPAASPKFRPRVTSDEWTSGAPRPPPRRMDSPKYQPPVYTAPINPRQPNKPTLNGFLHHASDPTLPKTSFEEPEEERKPPAAPPRRINSQEDRRRQANLEEALNELEAIYKKLEDLQETPIGGNSDAEPRREDDMAYRRLNKREPSCQDVREIMSQAGSYLLVSPTLSPSPITPPSPMIPVSSEPDITLDDVVYRSMNHMNNTLKCADPQLPFGIPVGPISPAPSSDYLHAEPSYEYKPPNQPDVVTDDLAFRNLRKDNQELRKKKAVRSMSANLSNVILKNNNNVFAVNKNDHLENKSQSYSNIPEEMRLAQRILDIRRGKLLENKQPAFVPKVKREEMRKKFFDESYNRNNESVLLKQLEDEARATSKEIDQKLSKTNATKNEALYSKSMTDLLDELTKNLDYDFGQSQPCTTCGDKIDPRLPVLKKKHNSNYCYQTKTEDRKPPFSLSFEEHRFNNVRPQVRSKSVYSGSNNKVLRDSWENLPKIRKKTESPRGWETSTPNNLTLDELCYNLSSSPKSGRSSSLKIPETSRPYESYYKDRSESYDCPSTSPNALRRRTPTASPTSFATRRLTPSPSYIQKSRGESPRSWESNLEELCNFHIVRKESPRPWLTRQSPVDGELPTAKLPSSSHVGARSMDDGQFFAGERRLPKPRWSSMRDTNIPEPVASWRKGSPSPPSWRKGSPSPTSWQQKRPTDEPFPGQHRPNWQSMEEPKIKHPAPWRHSLDTQRNPLKIDEPDESNSSPDSIRGRLSVSPHLRAGDNRLITRRSSPSFHARRSPSRELQSSQPPPSTSSVRPCSSTSPIDVAAMEAESTLDEEKERQGSLMFLAYCMACVHQIAGLDLLTIFAIALAVTCLILLILI